MRRWIMALMFCLLMAAECAAEPVRVRSFDAVVDVAGNGDIVVCETLSVDIPEGGFHGIFRDIPVVTRWRGQGRATVEVLAVRLDGNGLPADDVRRESGFVRVYQRDRTRTLSPGRHEFFLSYRMTGQTGLFEDNDELTWNVTGSGWEAPVDQASCTVLCPAGAPFFGQKAWLGRAGSRQSPVTMSHEMKDGRLVMHFEAQRSVSPGEDFTVAAGWGKGFVVPDEREGQSFGALLYAALDAVIFLYFLVAWYFTGRDPKKGVIVPLFHPPLVRQVGKGSRDRKGSVLSPATAGYFFHRTEVTPGCFGAALISLAGRGCCIIDGNAEKGFFLKKGVGESPHAEENRILACLDEKGMTVDAGNGERLHAMRQAMSEQLRRDWGNMWRGGGNGLLQGLFGSVWMFLGVAATLIGLAIVTGCITGGLLPENGVAVVGLLLFVLLVSRQTVRGSLRFFRAGKRAAFVFSLLFQAVFFGFIAFFLFMVGRDIPEVLSSAEIALVLLALLIPYGFSFIMDAPVREARAMLDDIEGLALYMRMAESPALKTLNPPERTLEHYRELLPYAVALDMERAWGAHFSDVLSAAAASGSQGLTPAVAEAFCAEADRSASSHAQSHSSEVSSSSSFGDGGGGAGSGGGGGGGGGC